MASAVEKLDQAIAAALSKSESAIGGITQAIGDCEEGNEILATALQGATNDEVLAAAQAQRATPTELAIVRGLLQTITTRLAEYRKRLGVGTAAPASAAAAAENSSGPAPPAPARSALPRPPKPGKTHGRWINSAGEVVVLESGRGGEYYEASRQLAVEHGLTRGHANAEPAIARHIETQFVARMIDQGITQAGIEINRPVCGTTPKDQQWPNTCDQWISRFLPEGWKLTVKDGSSPTGRTYVGRKVTG
ncbi:DddA-like double-stranded DNA deaminase toxin [Saccharopolyspora shandongensis]|uniref:DddA-like double-stranded DNA deaminase toxin n=1 Tax=Saccharopolyspora shandongensis TaxID=418495 RepID=UPI00340053C8